MSWPRPVRVVAVGSPLGDDAVGWEVLRALRLQIGDRPGIELHAVEGGQGLIDLLDGRGTLLVVDAVVTGAVAGTVHCFGWPEPRVETLRPGSTHQVRPAEALRLAGTLGLLPPQVVVYGIELERLDPHVGLSPSVAAAVPVLAERLATELVEVEADD